MTFSRSPRSSVQGSRVPGIQRFLTRALVLLLVPLAITFQTRLADAAYGPGHQWSVSSPSGPGGDSWTMTCAGSSAYSVSATVNTIVGKVRCDVAIDMWNDPDPGELDPGHVTVVLSGNVEGTGAACTYTGAPITGDVLTTLDYETGPTSLRCEVNRICVDAYVTDPGAMAAHDFYEVDQVCETLEMGPLPQDQEVCAYGTPTVVTASNYVATEGIFAGYHSRSHTVQFETGHGNAYWPQGTLWKHWYVSTYDVNAQMPPPPPTPHNGNWRNRATGTLNGDNWVTNLWTEGQFPRSGNSQPASREYEPFGTWVTIRSGEDGSYGVEPLEGLTKQGNEYRWGDNDPGNCVFYFGPKFRDEPGTLDDPQGPLNGEPNPEPPPEEEPPNLEPTLPPETSDCEFSFTDPSTWATAGICVLVKMIQKLISKVGDVVAAIRDLPADIWAFIRDGLYDLFVPSESFQGRVDRIAEAYEEGFPFNFGEVLDSMGAAGDTAPDGMGSCPAWDVAVGDRSWSAVCDSSFTAAIRGARPFILAGLLAVAFWPLLRGVFYASMPLVKPAPGSGGDR